MNVLWTVLVLVSTALIAIPMVSMEAESLSGGPDYNDGFGYTFKDSDEPEVTYGWIDHSGGTLIELGDDQLSGIINIGFNFPYFGNEEV
ncbi:MAG: hypothetical protein KAT70_06035, partial [Thermoplasmata archaeon]|nr:hypothetical protein [Thermoplasmata archaeon]